MPVDRRLRNELAYALAAYMRDRSTPRDFYACVKRIHEQLSSAPASDADHSAAEIADEIRLMFESGKPRERFDTAEQWELQRRRLAFLRSERSLPTTPMAEYNPLTDDQPPPRRLARTLLIVLLLSLAAWPWAGWYAFAACWAISPLVWLLVTFEHNNSSESTAWPFETEAQWRDHEVLLTGLKLPPSWEASPHYRRPLPRWWRATVVAAAMGLLLLVIYLLIASIWPLYVIAMSVARSDEPHDHHDAAPATH